MASVMYIQTDPNSNEVEMQGVSESVVRNMIMQRITMILKMFPTPHFFEMMMD